MENPSPIVQRQSKEAIKSAISKSQKALIQMTGKGANTTVIEMRLKALEMGLAVLDQTWNGQPVAYTLQELAESRVVLFGLLPALEKAYAKSKPGSPQKTLLARRLKAMELTLQAMDKYSSDQNSVT